MAAGAATACPGRKVISLQVDGRGLYTLQGLWTQAREKLDIEDPDIDWVKLAGGMGVAAERVTTVRRFAEVFDAALRKRGPFLIEGALP